MDLYRVDVHELKAILNKMTGIDNTASLSSARANLISARPNTYHAMSGIRGLPPALVEPPHTASPRLPPAKYNSMNGRRQEGNLITASNGHELTRLFTAKAGIQETTNISTARSEQGDRQSANLRGLHSRQARSASSEIYCGPCSRDGLHTDVEAYCLECAEYFCTSCVKHHKILKITKNHNLRQGKMMPIIKQLPEADDELLDLCEIHASERIQYFCVNHDEACCSVCATINHRQCKQLTYIPDINVQRTSKQCTAMIKTITNLIKKFDKVKDVVHKNLDIQEIQKSDYQQAILKLHQDISNLLQKFEKELMQDMSSIYESEKYYTMVRAESCEDNIHALLAARSALETTVDNGIESKYFLHLKKTEKLMNMCEKTLEDIKQKGEDTLRFHFRPDDNIVKLLKSVNALGSLVINHLPKRTAKLCTEFSAKSKSDEYQYCDISGSVVLEDGQIVLVDTYNESLKLFDSQYQMITQTKLSTVPWDVADVGHGQVIVTLPREKRLQYFDLNHLLRPLRKIGPTARSRASEYHGVAYCQDKLYVSCPNDDIPNIKVMDMQGKYLKEINTKSQPELTLSDPRYIAITRNGRRMYISDCGNNSVVSLGLQKGGRVVVYQQPYNQALGDLTIQPDGNVYVCGYTTDNIIQLSEACNYGDELLGNKDGIHRPQSISYCPGVHRIIVTMEKSHIVKVYQIS